MAFRQRPAGVTRLGRRFHISVYFGIVGGGLLIAASELPSGAALVPAGIRDAGLVVGGILVGLVALLLNDVFRSEPELARIARERETERRRHQDERRLDFEQYRALQADLRAERSRASALHAKLDLTGALDRDRVGDALLLGFYFHRRGERLPSAPNQPIFDIAAKRLKLLTEPIAKVKLEKAALQTVLEIAYGRVVSEAFDLGYLLGRLGDDAAPAAGPEVLKQLQEHLKALRIDADADPQRDLSARASRLFTKLAQRVLSIVRRA